MAALKNRQYENTQEIVLERRILIGRIVPGNGPESMLATAFLELGRYYADNDDEAGIEVEFEYGGRKFYTALTPSEEFIRNRQLHEPEYD